ncbi:hypothetical protein ACP6PL_03015 [Dapis sp. BLCC M126]|uniref:hypothetical protein n=1 Tax=Dapis sp. BLCC M126 TaxID=3400189 RepID=UPI003CEE8023
MKLSCTHRRHQRSITEQLSFKASPFQEKKNHFGQSYPFSGEVIINYLIVFLRNATQTAVADMKIINY